MEHQVISLLNNQVVHKDAAFKRFTDDIPIYGQDPQGPREDQKNQITKEGQDIRNDYIFTLQETGQESFNCISYIAEVVIITTTPIPTQEPPK